MSMKTYCEVYARYVLPAIRAYLSRELVLKYGLSQFKVSKILGVKQSAVNYFVRGTRKPKYMNILENTRELKNILDNLAEQLARGLLFDKCYVCGLLYSNRVVLEALVQAVAGEKINLCRHLETGVN